MPEYFGKNGLNLENLSRKLMLFYAVAQFDGNRWRQRPHIRQSSDQADMAPSLTRDCGR